MSRASFCALVIIFTWIGCGCTLKILGVFPWASHSHFTVGFRLMKELADRGHDVTFISSFPQKKPIQNLKDVSVAGFAQVSQGYKSNLFNLENMPLYRSVPVYLSLGNTLTNYTYSAKEVQELLKSEATFDVIVMEEFLAASLMGLSYYYKAPLVFVCAQGANLWNNNLFGNPAPSSYVPNMLATYSSHMTYFQRLHNLLVKTIDLSYRYLVYYPKENQILHQHFPEAPHLNEILYNASLILLNSHTSLQDPVPLLPNMIEIAGYHVSEPKPLPADLRDFLDTSQEGVVYFSLGSSLRSADMPIEKRNLILKVFSKIKQKVFWKFEADNIDDLPGNVKIQKWLPQQDILAHPNVKVFISHGGLLSTIETIYHGVPILGIPIFADQKMNMATAVANGYAVSLPFGELTEEKLRNALEEILKNPSYHQNVKRRSKLLRDRPVKPLDLAVYWIEYVARNGRCEHFRSAALDLAWYQRSMLDIAVVFVVVVAVLIFLFCYIVKKLLKKHVIKQELNHDKLKSE